MAACDDFQNIKDTVYQGVGLGILAGVSMKTIQIVEKGVSKKKRRSKKKKYKLNIPNVWKN